jgi:hypothetical protein
VPGKKKIPAMSGNKSNPIRRDENHSNRRNGGSAERRHLSSISECVKGLVPIVDTV